MTTPASAKRTALLSMVVVVAMAATKWIVDHRNAKDQESAVPPPSMFIAAAIVTVALTGIADPLPELASSFAVLVLVATAVFVGAPTISTVRRLTGQAR